MKKHLLYFFSFFFLANFLYSQVIIDSLWKCAYATWDDDPNATTVQTSAVGTFIPNTFVASTNVPSKLTAFLVGFRNATDSTGRLGRYAYDPGLAGYQQKWTSGLDEVAMLKPWDIATSNDSLVYVANNDTTDRNILVFAIGKDSVYSTDYRTVTPSDANFGIDVDKNGRVYLAKEGTETTKGSVIVYKSIAEDISWALSHQNVPLTTIQMPDAGFIRGIAVSKFGNIVYVSNYTTGKVYCFRGTPQGGYTLYPGFNLTILDSIPNSATLKGRPMGLKFMPDKNILLVACHSLLAGSAGYRYGKVYLVNPNTGEILGQIDIAAWNFKMTGSYNSRPNNGRQPKVSGYASVYCVDVDKDYGVYTNSYYGWTVDKWVYEGTLPVIPFTISEVSEYNTVPESFNLEQNYPNPFNPSTTITFTMKEESLVNLNVYDQLGRKAGEIISNTKLPAGRYHYNFDASRLSSGVYFYTLTAGNNILTKKMTLIK